MAANLVKFEYTIPVLRWCVEAVVRGGGDGGGVCVKSSKAPLTHGRSLNTRARDKPNVILCMSCPFPAAKYLVKHSEATAHQRHARGLGFMGARISASYVSAVSQSETCCLILSAEITQTDHRPGVS